MQACTFTNSLAGSVLLVALGFAGCNSSASTPEEQPSTAATANDPVPEASDVGSESGDTSGTSEKWEGEAEATGAAPETGSSAGETRTTEAIQKVILANRKSVRDCYDKARKELPTLRGNMTIQFVLDPEGKVKKAELNLDRSEIKSTQVADCAIAVLKSLKFPESSRGMDTTVNYPFDFKP